MGGWSSEEQTSELDLRLEFKSTGIKLISVSVERLQFGIPDYKMI